MKKFAQVLLLVVVPILAALGWLERTRLQAWYYVWHLSKADNSERDLWIERVTGLDQGAVPALLRCLCQPQESACENSLSVLERLACSWGPGDPRTLEVLEQLSDRFGGFSCAGRRRALQLQHHLLNSQDIPSRAVLAIARKLAVAGLTDEWAENRSAAIRLACHPGLHLFPQLVPLMSDREADVRAAALVAVGGVQKVESAEPEDFLLASDDLLPWLHDADADVRRLCETILRGRGLSDGQVELGRLITHEQAQVRLQVLACLRQHRDVDWGVWLMRLSRDSTPAVRAAAVRAAAERKGVDFVEQLWQIAQNDPTPTVRQIANHYLKSTASQNSPSKPSR